MPDREKVIHLVEDAIEIVEKEAFLTIANGLRDALAMMKEQEERLLRWERDTALSQLEEIGKGLGSKMDDVVALLKEHEAVKPKSKVRHGANAQIQHFCGNCNSMLHGKPKFCSECGKGVLW